jgi:hypothetical protein
MCQKKQTPNKTKHHKTADQPNKTNQNNQPNKTTFQHTKHTKQASPNYTTP